MAVRDASPETLRPVGSPDPSALYYTDVGNNVRDLALRASRYGPAGDPAPVHPHLFRHARVRQIVRSTRNLPLAQRQAGWSRLQLAYRSIGDEEARALMHQVPE